MSPSALSVKPSLDDQLSPYRPSPLQLPFEETADDSAVTLPMIRLDADVNDLRDFYGADLVQMIGGKMTQCGRG